MRLFRSARPVLRRCAGTALVLSTLAALSGCDPVGTPPGRAAGPTYPEDEQITKALQEDYAQDPSSAQARDLVRRLGGDQGTLQYAVRRVVYRQPAYEVHYDVALKLAQDGAESLRALYASMVPAPEDAKLQDKSLAGYEQWLAAQAQALEKTDKAQAAALRRSVETLGKCYRERKSGETVDLMGGLRALVSPARDGFYAEKLESPRLQLVCLPA